MDFAFVPQCCNNSLHYSKNVEKLCQDFTNIINYKDDESSGDESNIHKYLKKYTNDNNIEKEEKQVMDISTMDLKKFASKIEGAKKIREKYFSKYLLPVVFYPKELGNLKCCEVPLDQIPSVDFKGNWKELCKDKEDKNNLESYCENLFNAFSKENKILSGKSEKNSKSYKSNGYGGYGDDEKIHVDHYAESLQRAQKYGVLGKSAPDFGFDIFVKDYDFGDKEKNKNSNSFFSLGDSDDIEKKKEKESTKIEHSSITYRMYSEFFDECREKLVNGNYNYNENIDNYNKDSKNLNGQSDISEFGNAENENVNENDTHKDDYEEEPEEEAQKKIDNLKNSINNKPEPKTPCLEKFLDLNSINIPNHIKGLNNKIKSLRKEGASKNKPELVGNSITRLKLEKENIKIKILQYILDAAEADLNVLRLDGRNNEEIIKNLSRFLYEGDSVLAECERNYKIMKEKDTGYNNDLTNSEAYDPFWFAKYLEGNNQFKNKALEIREYYAYRASLLAIYLYMYNLNLNKKDNKIIDKMNTIKNNIKNKETSIQGLAEKNKIKINDISYYMQIIEKVDFGKYAEEMKELKDSILNEFSKYGQSYDQSTIKRLEEHGRKASSMGSIGEQDLEYFEDDSPLLHHILYGKEEEKKEEEEDYEFFANSEFGEGEDENDDDENNDDDEENLLSLLENV